MTKQKSTKHALLLSVLSLLMCVSMLVGSTFAWFTDSVTSAGNKIQSGTLKLDLELLDKTSGKWNSIKDDQTPIFDYDKWEPGYTDVKILKVENEGSLALKWYAKFVSSAERSILEDVIDVYVCPSETAELTYPADRDLTGYTKVGTLKEFINTIETTTYGKLEAGKCAYLGIALKMQESAGNDYQDKTIGAFDIMLLATQDTVESDSFGTDYDANAEWPVIETADEWDGTADTSWYNETDTEFTLSTAEQLAGLAELTGTTDQFEGKTINLGVDIDLDGKSFAPIGTTGERDSRDRLITKAFKGTFDGGNHTIANMSQSGWDFGYEWGQYGSIGMFSQLEGATVKNVVLEGFDCAIEGGDISFIAGSATGDCLFENIEIKSGSIGTYNNGIGGIIGWSGAGTYNFKNITLGEDVVIGGLWGSFDSSIGGIVGQAEPGATYNFENVNVACRIDAYNDCTASYDYYNYRMCGMLIGRLEETTTIDGKNYPDTSKYNITCTNVTVTYGDWANYHYCRAEGARAKRVEAGYAYDGIAADYDHSVCTVHHMELIPFDQIFGGDQFGVTGLKTYDGVTVIYNNK